MNDFQIFKKGMLMYKYANDYVLNNISKVHRVYRDNLNIYLNQILENTYRANLNNGNIRNKYQKEIIVDISLVNLNLEILKNYNDIDGKRIIKLASFLSEYRKMIYGWMNEKEE
jgi:hypothetical protein